MRHLISFLVFGIFPLGLIAQLHSPASPPGFGNAALPPLRAFAVMPAVDREALEAEDLLEAGQAIPPRFGYAHEVALSNQNNGQWDTLPNGDKLWRLGIQSRGALSLNLVFDHFWLPPGGRLFLYSADQEQVLGAFTQANHKPDSAFATGLILGESLVLEYHEPARSRFSGSITLGHVVHGYRNLWENGSSRGFGASGPCHVNVNCPPYTNPWGDEAAAVALIIVNGNRLCSGVMLNNVRQDCTPYLLTGHHCLQGFDAITNPIASSWTFLWHYESANCSNINGPLNMVTNGAVVVANDPTADFALLRLVEDPNDSSARYDVYLAGWNRSNSVGAPVTAIHHPRGDIKKISIEQQAPSSADYLQLTGQTHWRVANWDVGATEGGSSGGPLFDVSGRVIGHLHGGNAACLGSTDNGQPDWFGKLAYAWDNNGATDPRRRLRNWLDPDSTRAVFINGKRCSDPVIFFTTTGEAREENSKSPNPLNSCYPFEDISIEMRISAAPNADALVFLHTTGSSATEGPLADFEIFPDTLRFAAGSRASQAFTIRVYNDAYVEPVESVTVSFSLFTTGNAIPRPNNQVYTLNIFDNDAAPADRRVALVEEDFSGSGLPQGWSVSTQDATSNGFLFGDAQALSPGQWSIPPHRGNMAATNDDACSLCNKRNDKLITPSFDLPPGSQPELRFDAFFEGLSNGGTRETAQVEVSSNGGSSWTPLFSLPGNSGWVTHQVDLSAYAGISGLKLAFRYNDGGSWLYGMAIDNVSVTTQGAKVQTSANVGMGDEQYLGPWNTVHFYDPVSEQIMLSLQNLSSHDFGCTSVEIDRADPELLQAALPFVSPYTANYLAAKTYSFNPQYPNSFSPLRVSLYYTEAEIAAWEAATGQQRSVLEIVAADTFLPTINPGNAGLYAIQSQFAALSSLDSNLVLSAAFSGNIQGLGIGAPSTTLPVTLHSFQGSAEEKGIRLYWQTLEESPDGFFSLDRWSETVGWLPLGKVASLGHAGSYEFWDIQPGAGKNLYRLFQTDLNGIRSFLGKVEILWHPPVWVSLFPNPAQQHLTLTFAEMQDEPIAVELFSVEGKRVFTNAYPPSPRLELEAGTFAPGMYLVRVSCGGKAQVLKLTIGE